MFFAGSTAGWGVSQPATLGTARQPPQESTADQPLSWLRRAGVDQVIVVRDPASNTGQKSIAGDPSLPSVTFVSQDPLGSAVTLRRLMPELHDTFAILCWPLEVDVDLPALLDYHRSRGALVTLALCNVDDPMAHLMIACNSLGKVTSVVAEPAEWWNDQRTAAIGLYLVEPPVLARIPEDREFDWELHLLPLLVAQGEAVFAQLVDGLFDEST
jgi:NDP-sugar pyrophosphorylase family protein